MEDCTDLPPILLTLVCDVANGALSIQRERFFAYHSLLSNSAISGIWTGEGADSSNDEVGGRIWIWRFFFGELNVARFGAFSLSRAFLSSDQHTFTKPLISTLNGII